MKEKTRNQSQLTVSMCENATRNYTLITKTHVAESDCSPQKQ